MSSGSDSKQNHLTAAELGTLILRGFAVLAVFQALRMFSGYLAHDFIGALVPPPGEEVSGVLINMWLQIISSVIIAFIFWMLAPRAGSLLAKGFKNKTISNITYEQVMSTLFIALGCLLLLEALDHAVTFLTGYIRHLYLEGLGFTKEYHPNINALFSAALFFVLSLIFILKAGGISRAVTFLRSAGKDKSG